LSYLLNFGFRLTLAGFGREPPGLIRGKG